MVRPDRVNVFKTEPTGIIHTIEGYIKPDKPKRVSVFGSLGGGSDRVYGNTRVILSNLEVDLNPINKIWGKNPNHIIVKADIIINTTDSNTQQFFYEVLNSYGEIIAMQIHPQNHKIKSNTKTTFIIGIDQPSKNAYFLDGYYVLRAWSVSTWTGNRFDWKQPLANLGHTGIKEWTRSSNIAEVEILLQPEPEPEPEPDPNTLAITGDYDLTSVTFPEITQPESPAATEPLINGQQPKPEPEPESTINFIPLLIGAGILGVAITAKKWS